jgi:hypothetical protein
MYYVLILGQSTWYLSDQRGGGALHDSIRTLRDLFNRELNVLFASVWLLTNAAARSAHPPYILVWLTRTD